MQASSERKTAYELARSQVSTPTGIVALFWEITHQYRKRFSTVLDLGAGDGRFALGGRYASYLGVEIDPSAKPDTDLPDHASIAYGCAFDNPSQDFSACIGNPPYVRHHDLDPAWRNKVADRMHREIGIRPNRTCNLYVYFIGLALSKAKEDGVVSLLLPYEWVARPAAAFLRQFIKEKRWDVDVYRFTEPVFGSVLTTSSILVIDKSTRGGKWTYRNLNLNGDVSAISSVTGTKTGMLPYESRGDVWAMRGMSPGTQKVFVLTEGERLHAGLKSEDVFPCVTSLRGVEEDLTVLTAPAFKKRFVEAGARCWLVRSCEDDLSDRLKAYLAAVPETSRDTATCNARKSWHKYPLSGIPRLLVSSGFTGQVPKILVNSVGARAVGSVSGIYADHSVGVLHLQRYLKNTNFEDQVVPHANGFKKVEIRQLNAILKQYERESSHG